MYLQLSGKLNQYINMHYSYLAYISMILSFLLAVVQLYIWMKNLPVHSHLASKKPKSWVFFCSLIPLIVGIGFPDCDLGFPNGFSQGLSFSHRGWLFQRIFKTTKEQTTNTSSLTLAVILPSLLMNPRWELQLRSTSNKIISRSRQKLYGSHGSDPWLSRWICWKTFTLTGFIYKDPQDPGSQFPFPFWDYPLYRRLQESMVSNQRSLNLWR